MSGFFSAIEEFFQGTSVWVYIFIFFGRLLDVSAATLRIVLINRGERFVGSLVAFVEIIVWLFVARSVLSVAATDPIKIIVYAVAFSLGTYVGSWLEEKLAFGLAQIQTVVTDHDTAATLQKELKAGGYGATVIDVRGIEDEERYMLITYVRRKTLPDAARIIERVCPKALVTISDVKTQHGGYLKSAFSRRKG